MIDPLFLSQQFFSIQFLFESSHGSLHLMAYQSALLAAVKPSPILRIIGDDLLTTILTIKDSRKCLFSLFWMLPVQPFTPRRTKAISVILGIRHIHYLIAVHTYKGTQYHSIRRGFLLLSFVMAICLYPT